MHDDHYHNRLPRRWPISRIPDTIAGLEDELDTDHHPRWTPFDTFLRRTCMIGVTLLVWVGIVIGAVYCVDRIVTPPPVSDMHPTDAPSLLSCETGSRDC